MPINSGYSFYEYAGDGVTTRFPVQFSLGELKRAYVTCRVDNEVDGEGAPVYREITDVPGDPGMVEIQGAVPANGAHIVFRRIVPKELLLHLYANGSILDYPSLDESHLQLMMALHEVLDGYGLTNVFTDINMNGYKLLNVFSDPDDPSSLATVEFLGTYRQDALNAAITAADSALEALGYSDTALTHANAATAQVVLCSQQAELAEDQAALAEGYANSASGSASTAAAAADAASDVLEYVDEVVNMDKMPIGMVFPFAGTTAPAGSVALQGQLLSRTGYADLWTFAQTSGNMVASDAVWTILQFSPGDGSTTFRIPDLSAESPDYLWCIKAFDVISNPAILNAQDVIGRIGLIENGVENVITLTGASPVLRGGVLMWTLNSNSTPTDGLQSGQSATLMVDDGSAYSITWPTITWVNGLPPALATSGFTVVIIWKVEGTLYGRYGGVV